ELVTRRGVPPLAAEAEVFGCTHAAVGASVLGLWGLPEEIVEAVAFHHEPAPAAAGGFSPALAVYVANELADGTGPSDAARAALTAAGCEDRFDVWASLVGACREEPPP